MEKTFQLNNRLLNTFSVHPIDRFYFPEIQYSLFPGKSTKGRIYMKDDETYKLTWKDVLFGLVGSTVFIVMLQLFTGGY